MEEQKVPEYALVHHYNGDVSYVPVGYIVEHDKRIIKDNIAYGFGHDYETKEIVEYKKEAQAELKELKRKIKENPNVVLKIDGTTERYIVDEDPEVAEKLRRMEETEFITHSDIVDGYGWTKSLDKFLPEPILWPNTRLKGSPIMRMWRKRDIESVMETADFQSSLKKINKKKALANKAAEEAACKVDEVVSKIEIPILPDDELRSRVLQHRINEECRTSHKPKDAVTQRIMAANSTTVNLWVVDYIRFALVKYKNRTEENGRTVFIKRLPGFQRRLVQKIGEVYPKYKKECEKLIAYREY